MGIFTIAKQYQLGLNIAPAWWLSGASIDLDFKNGRYYDSSLAVGTQSLAALNNYLSVSRASTGYSKKSDGTLTSFAANTLRLTNLGLLVEDARTNLQQASQTFANGSIWFADFSTIVDNQTTAPDGTLTAAQFVEDTANGQHRLRAAGNTITSGAKVTASLYVKALGVGSLRYVNLEILDGGTGTVNANINTVTGAVITSNIVVYTNVSATSESLANGWFRVTITATSGAGIIQAGIFINLDNSGTGLLAYTGDGTSGAYLWGAQLEQSVTSALASSYIPTTSTSVTRAKDVVTCSGNLATVLQTLPQSVFADVQTYNAALDFLRIVADGNTSDNRLLDMASSDAQVQIYNVITPLVANLGNSQIFSAGAKVASAQQSPSSRSIVGGGGTVATDTSTAVALTTPTLGSGQGGFSTMFGYIRRVAVWNSKLADATLQALTMP